MPTLPKKQRPGNPRSPQITQYKAQPQAGSPVAHTAFHELQQRRALKPQGELKQSPSCRTCRADMTVATEFGDLRHKTQALHL